MNLRLTIKLWMLGAAALGIATASDAFTLGRARGAVLLGQPLELTVPVQLAADEAAIECFEAEVFYGDFRQDPSRVRVNVSETTPGQGLNVKVTSFANVDEPVVSVYLRGGCGQKTTRKYVILADMASEPAVAPVAASTANVRPAQILQPAKPQPLPDAVQAAAAPPTTESPAARKKPAPRAKASNGDLRSADSLKGTTSATPPVGKRPRLKLAAIDLTERDPVLRLSNELLSTPLEDLQKRAEAVALWRSLNETAQDVLNEQARMRAVDSDLRTLREQTAKNQAQLLELGGRLERAEAQRYANPLVYGLFLLLLVLIVGLVWAWRRLRDANVDSYPWWNGTANDVDEALPSQNPVRETVTNLNPRTETQQDFPEKTQSQFAKSPLNSISSVDIAIDVDLDMGPSVFAPVARAEPSLLPTEPRGVARDGPKVEPGLRDFAHSVAGTLRAINSQELLDVRQQADFFMTLGQYEDAIHLLEADIKDNGESNPLVYLDLLKILHTLSRKDEFDRYRKEFNLLFTGEVPDYAVFNQSGKCLDQYPEVCSAISQSWNTKDELEIIERYLVKPKDATPLWEFDLEAYRDLLMLHGVAGRIKAVSESALTPFAAAKTSETQAGHQVDGISYDPSSVSFGGADTTPLPAIVASSSNDVDLNLESGSQNLIDFEVSGFSTSGSKNTIKK